MNSRAERPTAFLDAIIVAEILQGKPPSAALLDDAVRARVNLAINPIVLQEVFALSEVKDRPTLIDQLQTSLTILPVDLARAADLLEQNKDLRNYLSHSNDLLILASVLECDYFVTYDRNFARALLATKVKVVTPEEFLADLGVR